MAISFNRIVIPIVMEIINLLTNSGFVRLIYNFEYLRGLISSIYKYLIIL
jgi:hypothetical protein